MALGMEVGLGPGHTVLDGDPAPSPKQQAEPPIFEASLLRPNGWTGCIKMPLGMEVGLSPGDFVLDGKLGTQPLSPKSGRAPNLRPIPIVAKRLDGSRCHLVRK